MTITTDEAAELVKIAPATIRSWVMRGKLRPVRRGAKPLRFHEQDVIEAHYRLRSAADHARLDALSRRLLAS